MKVLLALALSVALTGSAEARALISQAQAKHSTEIVVRDFLTGFTERQATLKIRCKIITARKAHCFTSFRADRLDGTVRSTVVSRDAEIVVYLRDLDIR